MFNNLLCYFSDGDGGVKPDRWSRTEGVAPRYGGFDVVVRGHVV